ncbi:unnamed protein product, partial [Symbiodinium sp. CCMP2456]
MTTVPEVQCESVTGEQLAVDLAALTGRPIDEIKNEGAQDMVQLATGVSFVRPTAFVRVNPGNAGVLIVDAEIGNESPNEEQNGHQANGPVNLEVSAALTRMDFGKNVTKIWQRLDELITSDSRTESDKMVSEACAIADRLYNAQVGLAEAVYRREWNDEWAPLLSFVIPGTRMHSLGINEVQNGPNECMVETAWYAMTRAERMFLTKGNWHLEWKNTTNAKENLVHDLVDVYDWVMLPSCWREVLPDWHDCFEENAAHEGVVFIVRRRTKLEAHRKW